LIIISRYAVVIDVFKCDIGRVVDEFKYLPRWNGLARVLNDVRYLLLEKGEREDIIGYHKFDREVNILVKD
jgi:hypothetical protein